MVEYFLHSIVDFLKDASSESLLKHIDLREVVSLSPNLNAAQHQISIYELLLEVNLKKRSELREVKQLFVIFEVEAIFVANPVEDGNAVGIFGLETFFEEGEEGSAEGG